MIIFNDVRNNWDEVSSGERMDKVYISELEIEEIIGIYEW